MNTSESIVNICEALVEAQAKMPSVKMNKTNPFLHNKYADLGAIIETSQPILAKNGLAISQICMTRDGYVGVETVLLHKTGEWISSYMELPTADEKGKSQAQVAGSIITYIRRYSLAAILGMYSDEDGDGNSPPASKQPKVVKPIVKRAEKYDTNIQGVPDKISQPILDDMDSKQEPIIDTDESKPFTDYNEPEPDSEFLIPKSVIQKCKTPWDAVDEITRYAMVNSIPETKTVFLKYIPDWNAGTEINDIDEKIVIDLVKELTGKKFRKSKKED